MDDLRFEEMDKDTEAGIDTTRRRLITWGIGALAGIGFAVGSGGVIHGSETPPSSALEAELDEAIERMRAATIDFVNGKTETWTSMCSHADDASLFGGWGGYERGWAQLEPRYEWAAARFAGGEIVFEEIARYAGANLACTIHFERMQARLVGVEGTVPVNLRVSHVYRREADGWKLVNRHADNLVSITETESVIDR